jgi:hypothetical protein
MIQTDISDETMNAEKNILVDAHWISLWGILTNHYKNNLEPWVKSGSFLFFYIDVLF